LLLGAGDGHTTLLIDISSPQGAQQQTYRTPLLLSIDGTDERTHGHRPYSTSYVVKGSPYLITERRVPELIPVLGSQPAGDVSHKPGSRLPLLSAKPAVTLATLKRTATNFAAW